MNTAIESKRKALVNQMVILANELTQTDPPEGQQTEFSALLFVDGPEAFELIYSASPEVAFQMLLTVAKDFEFKPEKLATLALATEFGISDKPEEVEKILNEVSEAFKEFDELRKAPAEIYRTKPRP